MGTQPSLLQRIALCAAVGIGMATATPDLARADNGKITVEKIEYKGWKNNVRLSNGAVELVVTLDVGPRIISYRLKDGKNVFKEYTEMLGKTGESDWQIRGGHRLWVGPEDTTRTYAPDNGPVEYKEEEGGKVRFTPAPEKEYGIQKEIVVALAPQGSKVTVQHYIKNIGDKAANLAPWSLSVMDAGGVEIIPLPPKKPHPGAAKNAQSPKDFAPNQFMAIWPFFDFKDPRWHFGSKYITLHQNAKQGPTKIGLAHSMDWIAYLNNGTLFVKRFGFHENKKYPDHGCNFETFTNEDMLEMESMGPLVRLAAGKTVEHIERWELIPDVKAFKNEAEIDQNVSAGIMKE